MSDDNSLIGHLKGLVDATGWYTATEDICMIARGICEGPQAHIDALVGAGVLREWRTESYTVVKPKPSHVHDWRWSQLFVTHSYNTGEGWPTAEWMCLRCAARGRIDRPAVTDFREGRRYAGPEAPVIQET